MRAGDLTKRATFQRPHKEKDADGKVIHTYPEAFTAWVNLKPLRGGESVMASRMQSRSPAIVTFRSSTQARAVTSEWRVVIDGRIYESKEDPRETQDRALFEMLVEGGGNAGR
ncbi:phage head closure protein [Paracoccus sp. (in: a-proteobacteria)]|uniref:phage head closure protein n=1 Tax=Paracoccus sp. TaxID=267 RepID=UPI00289C1930|nr:phage head closure protein [Paracoccus sp. (in: a-proteobacteria)]